MKKTETKWLDKPDKVGFWWFKGHRTSTSKGYINSYDGVVEIREKIGYKEALVLYPGKPPDYSIDRHTGKWCYIGDMFDE